MLKNYVVQSFPPQIEVRISTKPEMKRHFVPAD
jgi:hypothetical protein